MVTTSSSSGIQRILVTLDGSDATQLALDIAARLAAILHAELEGVFVEDIDLISLTKLPFIREIKACSLIEQAMTPEQMQRDLNAQARQAERMLSQQAQSTGVRFSFRVWRGHATLDTLSSSFEADILSIARTPAYRQRVAPKQTVIENICVLYSGSQQGDKALMAARQLAASLEAPIRVLLPHGSHIENTIEQQAIEILAAQKQPFTFVYFDDLPGLTAMLNAAGNSVLIMEAEHPLFRKAGFHQHLGALNLPILIVR